MLWSRTLRLRQPIYTVFHLRTGKFSVLPPPLTPPPSSLATTNLKTEQTFFNMWQEFLSSPWPQRIWILDPVVILWKDFGFKQNTVVVVLFFWGGRVCGQAQLENDFYFRPFHYCSLVLKNKLAPSNVSSRQPAFETVDGISVTFSWFLLNTLSSYQNLYAIRRCLWNHSFSYLAKSLCN